MPTHATRRAPQGVQRARGPLTGLPASTHIADWSGSVQGARGVTQGLGRGQWFGVACGSGPGVLGRHGGWGRGLGAASGAWVALPAWVPVGAGRAAAEYSG
jgi:hypothetical protein